MTSANATQAQTVRPLQGAPLRRKFQSFVGIAQILGSASGMWGVIQMLLADDRHVSVGFVVTAGLLYTAAGWAGIGLLRDSNVAIQFSILVQFCQLVQFFIPDGGMYLQLILGPFVLLWIGPTGWTVSIGFILGTNAPPVLQQQGPWFSINLLALVAVIYLMRLSSKRPKPVVSVPTEAA